MPTATHICAHVDASRVLTKDPAENLPPEVERAYGAFLDDWEGTVSDPQREIVAGIQSGKIDPSKPSVVRSQVGRTVGEYTSDIETTLNVGAKNGAKAGRAVAARRHQLDVSFDVLPSNLHRTLDDWSVDASESVSSTMADDVTAYIKGAHDEGLGVDQLASELNDDVFEGRLKGSKAEQIARDTTVAPSNAGEHSAFRESDSIVAEEWLSASDGRVRASHADASGQIVGVDTTFLVGGSHARYPGDPSLPIEEATMCRCTILPLTRDDLSAAELTIIASGGRL